MNKARRDALRIIKNDLQKLHSDITALRDAEKSFRDSIPGHLVNSKRYGKSDEAVDSLGGAIEELDIVIDYIRSAIK